MFSQCGNASAAATSRFLMLCSNLHSSSIRDQIPSFLNLKAKHHRCSSKRLCSRQSPQRNRPSTFSLPRPHPIPSLPCLYLRIYHTFLLLFIVNMASLVKKESRKSPSPLSFIPTTDGSLFDSSTYTPSNPLSFTTFPLSASPLRRRNFISTDLYSSRTTSSPRTRQTMR